MSSRRNLLKIIGVSCLSWILYPYKFVLSETKKIINQNLTSKQKEIMFEEGTEKPFTSELLKEKRKGFYHCANCGNKLFSSEAKFDSGTGWPSFSEALPGAFKTKVDYSFGMKRIEYHCAKCGSIMDTFLTMAQAQLVKDFVIMGCVYYLSLQLDNHFYFLMI